ncbi:MAG: UDP-N-acetylmuramoyl-L-alanyl-D-glutamate--2,6-diaminopimelate ligase [Anaerolineales bacterium]|nr:UDP-N-acetylmuramoyl-L-alanyl-D-glutamate--2,6-diaminopimelate ligase [Anaerolineales bacterium]
METSQPRTLRRLFSRFPGDVLTQIPDIEVTGVTHDSRRVKPGDLFVAVVGDSSDGHDYISQAAEGGALAVVGRRDLSGIGLPYVRVGQDRLALAYLAAAFFGSPALDMAVIGVTGTDGKTTTANLIYSIFQAAGLPVGMITTVNARIGGQELDTGFHVTTPDAPDVQAYLAQMRAAGITHVILEATSHGLAQERLRACEFDVGVVTNITHEHLDYHGSYEAYRAAKGRLFRELGRTGTKRVNTPRAAVLNRGDQSYEYLIGQTAVRPIAYGDHPQADIRAADVRPHPGGQDFTIVGPGYRHPAKTNLPGAYNIANCLAAAAAAHEVFGIDLDAVSAGIADLAPIPGRMEVIALGQDFTAIVDFAHTPNALKRSLEAVRPMTDGRIIAVFGSAGLRDRQKRRMMAEIAVQLADFTVLTAEDPRTESLEGILAEMAAGAASRGGVEGKSFVRIPDRGEAIRYAIEIAAPGDLVIAEGKGHEQSMCFGVTEYPWDDRTAMRAALSEHLGVPGPEMPRLPTST